MLAPIKNNYQRELRKSTEIKSHAKNNRSNLNTFRNELHISGLWAPIINLQNAITYRNNTADDIGI